MFRHTKAECCICDFASTDSNLISLIFTASHGQSLVVCIDFSYTSKVVLLPRLVAAFRRTTIRPEFFQIFRRYVPLYAQVLLSPFRTPNLRVAKRKLGVHGQSLVVCNDFSYKSKVVLLPRLVAAFRRTTIRPQFFQIFRRYVTLYAQVLLSPFRTRNLRVAKRKVGVHVDSIPLKTGLAMFALVPHCQLPTL